MKKKMPTAKQMKDRQQKLEDRRQKPENSNGNDFQTPASISKVYAAAAENKKSSSASSATPAAASARPPSAKMVEVRISDITVVAGHNARREFGEQGLLDLSTSITEQGLIEPVIVAKDGKKLKLVAGERRLRAAKLAGEEFIEAKVYAGLSDKQIAAMALAENFDRADLNHIETAHALGKYRNAGANVKEISRSVRKSTDYVREHLDLLRLCEPVQRLVASGRLPIKQAALIARVGDVAKQLSIVERAVCMIWSSKKSIWEEDWRDSGDRNDYTMTMENVRTRVARAMLGLAAGGWPMDEEYADKRACEGCADNSATYAADPMLFKGIKPQGSDKKGHCTNEECYRKKEAAWAKVKAKRKSDAEKKKTEKIKKAREAGLDACDNCGRLADAGKEFKEYFGRKLCKKCVAKAKKREERGDNVEGYNAREKRVKALRKKFPWTEDQMLAVALHLYGRQLAELISDMLEVHSPGDVERILLLIAAGSRAYIPDINTFPTITDLLAGKSFSGESLKAIWEANNMVNRYEPSVGWSGEVDCVPLPDNHMAILDDIEALAKHWGIDGFPARPTLEIIKRQALKDVIAKGKRHETETALAACNDAEMLYMLLDGDEAIKKPAKWRTGAIEDRIGMLEMLKEADQLPVAGGGEATTKTKAAAEEAEEAEEGYTSGICRFCGCTDEHACPGGCSWTDELRTICSACMELSLRIQNGKKADALNAIAFCNSILILKTIENINPKNNWKRKAVVKRIEELKKAETLPY